MEGRAEPLTDEAAVRHVVDVLADTWPLEAKGHHLYGPHGPHGPHGPTAGPPPYTFDRIVPTRVFGLPGMLGMDQFDPADLPKPTRWDFETPH